MELNNKIIFGLFVISIYLFSCGDERSSVTFLGTNIQKEKELDIKIKALEVAKKEYENKVNEISLDTLVQDKNAKIDLSNKKIEANEIEIAKIKLDIVSKENEISTLNDRIAQLLKQIEILEKEKETNLLEITTLNNKVKDHVNRINELDNEIEDLKSVNLIKIIEKEEKITELNKEHEKAIKILNDRNFALGIQYSGIIEMLKQEHTKAIKDKEQELKTLEEELKKYVPIK